MAHDAFEDVEQAKSPNLPREAQGRAALLLVESLVHALISKSVISVAEAVEIVEIAADVAAEVADHATDGNTTAVKSHTLLMSIGESLKPDIA